MPANSKVLCLHCNKRITRDRERAHRRLGSAPYKSSSPSHARRHLIIDESSDSDGPQEGEEGHNSSMNTEFDGAEISIPGIDEEDFPPPSEGSSNSVGDLEERDDSEFDDDNVFASRVPYNLWHAPRGLEDSDDESDPADEPADIGDDPDEDYVDWDTIESNHGLSAWDRLGEGFEREVASIGKSPYPNAIVFRLTFCLFSRTPDRIRPFNL